MSTQKEVYYQQVAEAVFMHDHNAHIRHLYSQYPSLFIKPIKNHFQLLHKKYNEANKTLGATGVGLTSAKLQEHADMKKLLDKIIANFPWWEDLHSFWRTYPSYNMVFSTGDPGQDFANSAEANSQTKQMKIQALVIAKELKACNKNAQHEHNLKLKMAENNHKLPMATEKTK
ncbi:hypothetical protein F5141DRAFT_1221350 [Pisolithus sp. B1]|nr:hypothetical protein F5141DRAFT_1221350 [Pisolithus sp. B1]